jgi:hypothetical protein
MMTAIIIFEESSFKFSFVSYGLVTKSLEAECTFEEVAEKIKCQKMNLTLFTTKFRWILLSPSLQGAKSLEAIILYNDSEHNK